MGASQRGTRKELHTRRKAQEIELLFIDHEWPLTSRLPRQSAFSMVLEKRFTQQMSCGLSADNWKHEESKVAASPSRRIDDAPLCQHTGSYEKHRHARSGMWAAMPVLLSQLRWQVNWGAKEAKRTLCKTIC